MLGEHVKLPKNVSNRALEERCSESLGGIQSFCKVLLVVVVFLLLITCFWLLKEAASGPWENYVRASFEVDFDLALAVLNEILKVD